MPDRQTGRYGCDSTRADGSTTGLIAVPAFSDPLNHDTVDLWLVLEEDPETRNGYKVVYDEVNESFGLAITDTDEKPVFLGLYGGFLDAYDAM